MEGQEEMGRGRERWREIRRGRARETGCVVCKGAGEMGRGREGRERQGGRQGGVGTTA